MKYLKEYESNSIADLKIGDYVICGTLIDNLKKFFNNNIGKLVDILYMEDYHNKEVIIYKIEYDSSIITIDIMPYFVKILNNNKKIIYASDILYHSRNKKDLKIILTAGKYNL